MNMNGVHTIYNNRVKIEDAYIFSFRFGIDKKDYIINDIDLFIKTVIRGGTYTYGKNKTVINYDKFDCDSRKSLDLIIRILNDVKYFGKKRREISVYRKYFKQLYDLMIVQSNPVYCNIAITERKLSLTINDRQWENFAEIQVNNVSDYYDAQIEQDGVYVIHDSVLIKYKYDDYAVYELMKLIIKYNGSLYVSKTDREDFVKYISPALQNIVQNF